MLQPGQSEKKKFHLFQNLHVCSRLDRDGKYRNPALDYLRRGIEDSRNYYENNPLDDSNSGTEAPFNSPESTKLSLKKLSGDEDKLFQKSKTFQRLEKKGLSGDLRSHNKRNNSDTIRHTLYKSDSYGDKGVRKWGEDSENAKALRDSQRQIQRKNEFLRERVSRSQEDLERQTGDSYTEHKSRDSRSKKVKRSVSLPPIDADKQKSFSSGSSRYSQNKTKSTNRSVKLPSISQEKEEPHLRYQHGIARKNLKNDTLILSRDSTSDSMVHVTNYGEKKHSECKCKHPVVRAERSDKSFGSRPHTCEVCGHSVHTPKTASSMASSKHTSGSVKSKSTDKSPSHVRQSEKGSEIKDLSILDHVGSISRGAARNEDKSRSTSQYSRVTESGSKSDEATRSRKKVTYTLEDGQLAVPGTPPSYLDKLQEIQERMQSGMFDYEASVDISDVDTTLKMSQSSQRTRGSSSTSGSVSLQNKKFVSQPVTVFPDGAREAYIKALAMAQVQKMNIHLDPFWLEKQLSRSYVFSYYQNIPSDDVACPNCGNNHPPAALRHSMTVVPKGKEMKHIFGQIDVNDYYPGMPKNPVRGITEKLFNKKSKKKRDGKRESVSSGKPGSGLNVERQLSSMSNEYKQKMSNRKM